jgi:predicted phage-related endonuclease
VFLEMNAPPDAPEEHREEFDRGNFLEPGVLAWHAHKAGCVIRPVATLFHPKHERCAVTLDGIATYPHEERAAEAKTVHWKKASEWGEEGTDQIPKHYLIQANWGAGVAGLKRTDVPALIGLELRQYLVNFDAELFEMLLEQAERFLRDHIDTGKAPEVDGSEAANEWLDKRFEERELKLVADAEAEALMATLQEYRREMKSLEVCEDLAIQKLQEILGRNGADAMVGSDWSLKPRWRGEK